jgi:hypothetical protein
VPEILMDFYFVSRAAQLLDVSYKLKIPLDYMIVEVIFAELFHMPAPRYLEVCYGSIFIELCKLHPSRMPQVDYYKTTVHIFSTIFFIGFGSGNRVALQPRGQHEYILL